MSTQKSKKPWSVRGRCHFCAGVIGILFAIGSLWTPLTVAANNATASEVASPKVIRLGLSEFAERSINFQLIPVTLRALTEGMGPQYRLDVHEYSVADLQNAVKAGNVDIVISSAGTFRRLAIANTGIRDLATISSARTPNPNYADGSVFFTRVDRTDLNTVEDMRGKRAAAMHRYAFSGWQIAAEELLQRGYNPEYYFSQLDFYGHDAMEILRAVDDGRDDVGIVRACFLEDMHEMGTRFKVIGAKTPDDKITCARSTNLYPNWTASTLPSTPPEVSRQITAILLSMPSIEDGLHWSVATDFRGIDQLFWDLKIGPYEYLRHFNVKRFLMTYWPYYVPVLMLLLGLIFHVVTVSRLVRKRTAQLEASIAREKAVEAEAARATARFEKMQRVGVVGQMSSMIAHELRQPLATIAMFGDGLIRRFDNQTDTREMTVRTLEKMMVQTARASLIVDQVRAYAKGNRERSPQELNALAKRALTEVDKVQRGLGAHLRADYSPTPVWVNANALEIELVIINVVKNAMEALINIPAAEVVLRIEALQEKAIIRVSNNGPVIPDEVWENISRAAMPSSKDAGLGLGLSIVHSIVEDLGGRVSLVRHPQGGMTYQIQLQRLEKGGDEAWVNR